MELLDDDNFQRKKKDKLIELLPVSLIGLFTATSLVSSLLIKKELIINELIGLLISIILIIIFFINRKSYFYGTLFFLIVKTLNFFYLGSFISVLSLGIGSLSLSIQPISLAFLIFHIIFFNKELNSIFKEKKNNPNQFQIEKLKKSFSTKTINDLKYIVESTAYRKEAKIAAEELLKEKEIKS